jgi:hypothetical protein
LALVRCRSLEQSRYLSPGEWRKLLGLDQLPEVKTLRRKISSLCGQDGQAAQWQSRLAGEWMAGAHSESVGLFYADGHVRVYHGSLTDLPRRYVARERLCLPGTTDYWINGLGGEPFFVLTRAGQSRSDRCAAPKHRATASSPGSAARRPSAGCRSTAASIYTHLRPGGLFAGFFRRTQNSTHRRCDLS